MSKRFRPRRSGSEDESTEKSISRDCGVPRASSSDSSPPRKRRRVSSSEGKSRTSSLRRRRRTQHPHRRKRNLTNTSPLLESLLLNYVSEATSAEEITRKFEAMEKLRRMGDGVQDSVRDRVIEDVRDVEVMKDVKFEREFAESGKKSDEDDSDYEDPVAPSAPVDRASRSQVEVGGIDSGSPDSGVLDEEVEETEEEESSSETEDSIQRPRTPPVIRRHPLSSPLGAMIPSSRQPLKRAATSSFRHRPTATAEPIVIESSDAESSESSSDEEDEDDSPIVISRLARRSSETKRPKRPKRGSFCTQCGEARGEKHCFCGYC